jgi:sugar lactone lactonase YvrE
VAFSPDGRRLASATGIISGQDREAGRVTVWDAQTGREVLTLPGQTTGVGGVFFSPDGRRLATANYDGVAKVWDALTGAELFVLKGHTRAVNGVAFSPDGQRLATVSEDRSFSKPNEDRTVKVWDAHTGQAMLTLPGHSRAVGSVAFSPDSQLLASASQDGTAKIWAAHTGKELFTLTGHKGRLYTVAFSPQNKVFPDRVLLATGGQDTTAKLWDARTGQELFTFKVHTGIVWSVAFSPDGLRLATASQDSTIKIWDVRTGQELLSLKGHDRVLSVAFSPDGQRLATGGADSVVKIWNGVLSGADEQMLLQVLAQPDPVWHSRQINQFERSRQWLTAAHHLDWALAGWPEDAALRLRRAQARAELGRWDEAQADFAAVVKQTPDEPAGWHGLALTHLALKQPAAYRQTCGEMLTHFAARAAVVPGLLFSASPENVPAVASLTPLADPLLTPLIRARPRGARTYVILPDAVADPRGLLPMVGGGDPALRGAVLCRTGQWDDAAKALAATQDPAGLLYRALAQGQRGRAAEARKDLDRAVAWLTAPNTNNPKMANVAALPWDQRLEIDLLRAEIETLLAEDKGK